MKRKAERVYSDKLYDSNDADMQKLLQAVSRSVAESLARAEQIHKERLRSIRPAHAA